MRRTALLVVLLLLLGLITTVAVAWFYAGIAHPALAENKLSWWSDSRYTLSNGWWIREWSGPGKRARLIRVADERRGFISPDEFEVPSWSVGNQIASEASAEVFEDERGWPFLSLRCTWHEEQPFSLPNEPVDGGLSIRALEPDWMIERTMMMGSPDMDYVHTDQHRALPLIPIWPGLLGSTLFYSLLWLPVVFVAGGLGVVRRRFRRAKNRCTQCGYSLHKLEADTCPECGWGKNARGPSISAAHLGVTLALVAIMLAATIVLGSSLVRRFEGPGPLHVAAALNDCDEIRRLIDRGVPVDRPLPAQRLRQYQQEGSTPLMWAAARGHVEAVNVLLYAGAQAERRNNSDLTPLMLASRHDHAAVVELLLAQADLGTADSASVNESLWWAAGYGSPKIVKMLLSAGAQTEHIWGDGWSMTPLGMAANRGRIDNIRLLIDAGASVNPESGSSPLMMAIQCAEVETATFLMDAGARIDSSGVPLLWEAAEHDLTSVAAKLLERGADPDMSHPVAKGWTPLRRAVIRSNLPLARMLVEAGADPHITDDSGETILFQIDWEKATPEFVDFVLGLGIDINQRSDAGHTVLMYNVHWRKVGAVRRLLDAGSDVTIADNDGSTAIDYSQGELIYSRRLFNSSGQPVNAEIVRMLKEHVDR